MHTPPSWVGLSGLLVHITVLWLSAHYNETALPIRDRGHSLVAFRVRRLACGNRDATRYAGYLCWSLSVSILSYVDEFMSNEEIRNGENPVLPTNEGNCLHLGTGGTLITQRVHLGTCLGLCLSGGWRYLDSSTNQTTRYTLPDFRTRSWARGQRSVSYYWLIDEQPHQRHPQCPAPFG